MLILGLTVPNRLQALLRQPWVWKMTRLEKLCLAGSLSNP